MKRFISRWTARCVCTALAAVTILGTSAQAISPVTPSVLGDRSTATVEPRAEEFLYYYRVRDGKLQIRVWSVTFGKWVTDWMDYDDYHNQ